MLWSETWYWLPGYLLLMSSACYCSQSKRFLWFVCFSCVVIIHRSVLANQLMEVVVSSCASQWTAPNPQPSGAPVLQSHQVQPHPEHHQLFFFSLIAKQNAKQSQLYCNFIPLSQVTLHQGISSRSGQRVREESPKPLLCSWNLQQLVYPPTARERPRPLFPPHRVCPASPSGPSCPPPLRSAPWDDSLMWQQWTRGQYHPQ